MMTKRSISWAIPIALLAVGCSDRATTAGTPATGGSGSVGMEVQEPASVRTERERIALKLAPLRDVDAAGLLEAYPTQFQSAPSYDRSTLAGLSLIQGSSLALEENELSALEGQGFVISERRAFPSFAYGYNNIYIEDLPVYVSADSILDAVHRSYDDILQALESGVLVGEMQLLLGGMRERLKSGVGSELGSAAVADADVYLTVAHSLISGELQKTVAGGPQSEVAALVKATTAAQGARSVNLFGVARDEDLSQFEPRGHYADEPELQQYFRAMMWLGRIDFRLLETQPDGAQVFRRRQLEGVLLLHALVDPALRAHFERIDQTLATFVGEPDYMVLSQVEPLLADLGVTLAAEVAGLADDKIVSAILSGGYGTQRISSHIMINGLGGAGTLPLSASFALMGQRYVIDSHVFSNVVFDRAGKGKVLRLMPNPLDVAFAALGNDQAARLLEPELTSYPYAPDLGAMRVLVDEHPAEFWQQNLYNLWLGSIRTLSPGATSSGAAAEQLPPVARSEAWGRRLLNTQLASWADLRHDTVLYAKQSYTGGLGCDYPDAYVDPYPTFYAGIQAYAEKGGALIAGLGLSRGAQTASLVAAIEKHFAEVAHVAGRLREMAEYQLSGAEFTPEMLSFINRAVVVDEGCGDPSLVSGWYHGLFFNNDTSADFDPTIVDVHTQPTDEFGVPVGRVLHAGTGMPRLMVVVNETCSGPRAYAGLASSYFEKTTEDFERLTDEDWSSELRAGTPADVPWMADLVER